MNRKSINHDFLSDAHVLNLTAAAEHAYKIGRPLNRFITVNLDLAEVDHEDAQAFITSFLKHARDWLARSGVRIFYIWVRENPCSVSDRSISTPNVHIVIHVPSERVRRFSQLDRKWLRLAGGKWGQGVIKSDPLPHYHPSDSEAEL